MEPGSAKLARWPITAGLIKEAKSNRMVRMSLHVHFTSFEMAAMKVIKRIKKKKRKKRNPSGIVLSQHFYVPLPAQNNISCNLGLSFIV